MRRILQVVGYIISDHDPRSIRSIQGTKYYALSTGKLMHTFTDFRVGPGDEATIKRALKNVVVFVRRGFEETNFHMLL